jgi:hypothetical protein
MKRPPLNQVRVRVMGHTQQFSDMATAITYLKPRLAVLFSIRESIQVMEKFVNSMMDEK